MQFVQQNSPHCYWTWFVIMACLGFKFQEATAKKHMKMLRSGVIIQQKRSKLQFISLCFKLDLTCQVLAASLVFLMQLQESCCMCGFLPPFLFLLWLTLREQKSVNKINSLSSKAFLWELAAFSIHWKCSPYGPLLAQSLAPLSGKSLVQL